MPVLVKRTDVSGLGLISERIDDLRRGSDEGESGLFHLTCKSGVFREKSVSATTGEDADLLLRRDTTYPGWIMSTPCSRAILMTSS